MKSMDCMYMMVSLLSTPHPPIKQHFKGIYAFLNGIFAMLKTGPKFFQHDKKYEKEVYRKFRDFLISINKVLAIICK